MKEIIDLYMAFAKVGAVTFGGGYAMLPIISREIVEKRNWITEEELLDYFAISQCTPGVIAVNVATFVGQKKKGIWGGLAATLGVVTPSLLIIMFIAALLDNFAEYTVVKNAFAGIRACVCALVLNAVIKLWKKATVNIYSLIIFVLVIVGSLVLNLSPVYFVVVAGIMGIALQNKMIEKSESK